MYKIYNNEIKITNLLKGGMAPSGSSSSGKMLTPKSFIEIERSKVKTKANFKSYHDEYIKKKNDMKDATKRKQQLENENNDLRSQITVLEQSLNDSETERSRLQNDNNTLQNNNVILNDALNDEKKKSNDEIDSLRNKLYINNKKLDEIETYINGVESSKIDNNTKADILKKITGGFTSDLTDDDIDLPNNGKAYDFTDPADQRKIIDDAFLVRHLIDIYDDIDNEKNKKNVMTFILTYLRMIKIMEDNQLLTRKDFEKKHLNDKTKLNPLTVNLNKFFTDDDFSYFISDVKDFLEKNHKIKSECIKFVMKLPLLTSVPGVNMYPFRQMQGGLYQNLEYVLNGGAMTLIRVPSSIDNYRRQLKIIKIRLENSNKKLSSVTEQRIKDVIDKIEEHEKNLKDQLELLFYGPQVEGDDVDITTTENKEKLEKAKKTYRKTKRYNTVADTIFNRLAEVLKDNFDVQPKSTFKTY